MQMQSANFNDNFHVMQFQMYHALFASWSDLCLAPPLLSLFSLVIQPPSTHMSGGGMDQQGVVQKNQM